MGNGNGRKELNMSLSYTAVIAARGGEAAWGSDLLRDSQLPMLATI